MSRHRPGGSYGHRVRRLGFNHYRIGWTIDFYYPGDRLRYPRGFSRFTDHAGAVRFARKWGLNPPEAES